MAKDTKTTVKTKKGEVKEVKDAKITLNLLKPRATEKTYREQAKRTYAFVLERESSKQAVKTRVEKDYNVKVTDVRILTRKGHSCRFSRGKHAYPGTAFRKDRRIAYVTLAEGNSIKVFEEKTEETTKASAKATKAEAKAEAKEAKKAGKENK